MAPLTEKMTFNRFQLEENHLAPGLKLLACRDVFLVWFKAHVGSKHFAAFPNGWEPCCNMWMKKEQRTQRHLSTKSGNTHRLLRNNHSG